MSCRWGSIAVLLLVALCTAPARAETERDRFFRLNACPIVERLDLLAAMPPGPDRFIVVAIAGGGQRYVQCLFPPDRQGVLFCEASSGRYGPPEGSPGHLRLTPASISALAAAGFDTGVEDGNFPLAIEFGRSHDAAGVSEILLSALHGAYGARPATVLEILAPLAPGLSPGRSQCAPVG